MTMGFGERGRYYGHNSLGGTPYGFKQPLTMLKTLEKDIIRRKSSFNQDMSILEFQSRHEVCTVCP